MTLQDQIGQMLLLGWSGPYPATVNAHADRLLTELRAGGIILMGRNIGPPDVLARTIAQMQQRASECGLPPLFVAVDQEGGRVSRLAPPHYARPPAAREIGHANSPESARAWAAQIGSELRALGFNGDFAPVLDVDNNPANPVIGDRALSHDPQTVARLGAAAVRGFQEDAGIMACGKHFPGHGDTDTDSHHALPVIAHSRARLEQVELVPFRAALNAGAGAIMTAHILFPALDAVLPATLSPAILTGLLREEMGFDGLVITDDLEMQGVAQKWGPSEAAVLAVLAGADILLCCHTEQTQRGIQAALLAAAQSGRITQARLDQSLARIHAAKQRWVTNA